MTQSHQYLLVITGHFLPPTSRLKDEQEVSEPSHKYSPQLNSWNSKEKIWFAFVYIYICLPLGQRERFPPQEMAVALMYLSFGLDIPPKRNNNFTVFPKMRETINIWRPLA